jgi:hypothetical protein
MTGPARPPQWLFDEIQQLPSEARGWALGFMCAGWLAGREDGALMVLDKARAMPRFEPDVAPCPCGSLKAVATPSTRFEGQGGWDVRCACGHDMFYTLYPDTLPAWLDLMTVHTSRGRMREETPDSPKE